MLRQQYRSDNIGDLGKAFGIETAGCQGRGTDTQPGGHHRRARVVRHRVAVNGNTRVVQQIFSLFTGELVVAQIDQYQVNVGTIGGDGNSRIAHILVSQALC